VDAALWSGLGGKVAERWFPLLASPALLFWIGGVLAYVWRHGGLFGPGAGWPALGVAWQHTFGGATIVVQTLTAVAALLLVAGSARLADLLTPNVVRLLEGYWGRWAGPLRDTVVVLRGRSIDKRFGRWRELARRRAVLTLAERRRYARLNAWRAGVPAEPHDRMPTRFVTYSRRRSPGLATDMAWTPWCAGHGSG